MPQLASLVLTQQLDGQVKGLDALVGQHPPVGPVPAPKIALTLANSVALYFALAAAHVASVLRLARNVNALEAPRPAAGALPASARIEASPA